MTANPLSPIHPGEILLADFLEPAGLSPDHLARQIGVSPRKIDEIAAGKRTIDIDIAQRLSRAFGNSAQFWLTLQDQYNLDIACTRITLSGA